MDLKRVTEAAGVLLRRRLGQRIPLIVSWRLLFRCNLRCQYCHIPMLPTEELDTDQVRDGLAGFAAAGTRYVNFTGGEVLLRDDIGAIVDHAVELGISPSINTNGALLPRRLAAISKVSTLTLSLDGDESAHDAARGSGTFAQTMEALRLAKGAGIRVGFTAVLSNRNLHAVPWLLQLAEREQAGITFQPARLEKLGSELPDPITPPLEGYREAMSLVLAEKRRGNRWILNSRTTIEHLLTFPQSRAVPCEAGRLFFAVEPNGDLLACNDTAKPGVLYNIVRDGVARALAMTAPTTCEQCWCASLVEFNHASALRPEPVLNILRSR